MPIYSLLKVTKAQSHAHFQTTEYSDLDCDVDEEAILNSTIKADDQSNARNTSILRCFELPANRDPLFRMWGKGSGV